MNRLTFRCLITASVLFVLFCVPSIASADGILWTLNGVTFDDGGTASGSFILDSNGNGGNGKYTDGSINITTTLGAAFGGATYTALSTVFGSSNGGLIVAAGDDLLVLNFLDDLTNGGGGPVLLTGDGEGICDPKTGCTELRVITGGALIGTSVPVSTPEPSALLLLGMGLVTLLVSAAIRRV